MSTADDIWKVIQYVLLFSALAISFAAIVSGQSWAEERSPACYTAGGAHCTARPKLVQGWVTTIIGVICAFLSIVALLRLQFFSGKSVFQRASDSFGRVFTGAKEGASNLMTAANEAAAEAAAGNVAAPPQSFQPVPPTSGAPPASIFAEGARVATDTVVSAAGNTAAGVVQGVVGAATRGAAQFAAPTKAPTDLIGVQPKWPFSRFSNYGSKELTDIVKQYVYTSCGGNFDDCSSDIAQNALYSAYHEVNRMHPEWEVKDVIKLGNWVISNAIYEMTREGNGKLFDGINTTYTRFDFLKKGSEEFIEDLKANTNEGDSDYWRLF